MDPQSLKRVVNYSIALTSVAHLNEKISSHCINGNHPAFIPRFPWVHFIHNDSVNGSLETLAHPKQFSEYAKTHRAKAVYGPATHICHILQGLMNIFISNVSMLTQHWTANFVIKSILLLKEVTDFFFLISNHIGGLSYKTLLGLSVPAVDTTVNIWGRRTTRDAMRS